MFHTLGIDFCPDKSAQLPLILIPLVSTREHFRLDSGELRTDQHNTTDYTHLAIPCLDGGTKCPPELTIYIHGDLGVGKIKNKVMSHSRFSGNIGAGLKFAGFEAELVYDGFTRENPSGYASWIGIKAGISIGL